MFFQCSRLAFCYSRRHFIHVMASLDDEQGGDANVMVSEKISKSECLFDLSHMPN